MIADRLRNVRERIHAACRRSGREVEEVDLVLVTKDVSTEDIRNAHELGVRDFGENKAQEFTAKKAALPTDIRWHFIGHLQTNKVKSVVGQVSLIHSCDRLELARELNQQAEKIGRQTDVLIQVTASREASKHGFDSDQVNEAIPEILNLNRLRVRGLMTIGPFTEEEHEIRQSFRTLRLLRDRMKESYPGHDWRYLSMGMSSDFEIAIEEGANLLRIGTAVFGQRKIEKA